jgi:hypothetical protein
LNTKPFLAARNPTRRLAAKGLIDPLIPFRDPGPTWTLLVISETFFWRVQ